MELLVEGHNCEDSRLDSGLLLTATPRSLLFVSSVQGRVPDQDIEFGDLVSVLAGSRHLDRAAPVEVAVTQGVGQLLDLDLLERALVERHEAVGGQDTALGSTGRRDEEIERLRGVRL